MQGFPWHQHFDTQAPAIFYANCTQHTETIALLSNAAVKLAEVMGFHSKTPCYKTTAKTTEW